MLLTTAIALGSNLGDRPAHIAAAVAALRRSSLLTGLRLSPIYQTAPVATAPDAQAMGGPYLNAVAVASTAAEPADLLAALLQIERDLGRDRATQAHAEPRVIDLDLLLVGDRIISTPDLTLPHPRLASRLFVLEPLHDLAPLLIIPIHGRTVRELRAFARAITPADAVQHCNS